MRYLYSCRSDGDQFRITKLSTYLDVESSYLCSLTKCQCPGFTSRGRCRHLEMLPHFLARPSSLQGSHYYDFDQDVWRAGAFYAEGGEVVSEVEPVVTSEMIADAEEYIDRNPSLAPPEGRMASSAAPFQRRF